MALEFPSLMADAVERYEGLVAAIMRGARLSITLARLEGKEVVVLCLMEKELTGERFAFTPVALLLTKEDEEALEEVYPKGEKQGEKPMTRAEWEQVSRELVEAVRNATYMGNTFSISTGGVINWYPPLETEIVEGSGEEKKETKE